MHKWSLIWRKAKHPLIALVLAAVLLAAPLMSGAAWAVDRTQPCTVTVHPSTQEMAPELDMAGVVVDIYRVADMTDDGYDLVPMEPYRALNLAVNGEEDSEALAQLAAEIALNGQSPDLTATPLNVETTLPGPGLYLLLAHGSDVIDYAINVTDDSGATQLATVAYYNEYQYAFSPVLVGLPAWDDDNNFVYSADVSLKVERTARYGDLEIIKTLLSYETSDVPTFVFEVTARQGEKTVYSDVVSLAFDAPGKKHVLIKDLPAGASVTVTEVYSGATYSLTPDTAETQTTVIEADTQVGVEFENDYDTTHRHGHGITNQFTYDASTNWGWTQLDDTASE